MRDFDVNKLDETEVCEYSEFLGGFSEEQEDYIRQIIRDEIEKLLKNGLKGLLEE